MNPCRLLLLHICVSSILVHPVRGLRPAELSDSLATDELQKHEDESLEEDREEDLDLDDDEDPLQKLPSHPAALSLIETNATDFIKSPDMEACKGLADRIRKHAWCQRDTWDRLANSVKLLADVGKRSSKHWKLIYKQLLELAAKSVDMKGALSEIVTGISGQGGAAWDVEQSGPAAKAIIRTYFRLFNFDFDPNDPYRGYMIRPAVAIGTWAQRSVDRAYSERKYAQYFDDSNTAQSGESGLVTLGNAVSEAQATVDQSITEETLHVAITPKTLMDGILAIVKHPPDMKDLQDLVEYCVPNDDRYKHYEKDDWVWVRKEEISETESDTTAIHPVRSAKGHYEKKHLHYYGAFLTDLREAYKTIDQKVPSEVKERKWTDRASSRFKFKWPR
mmetsp:Transcript_3074/g.6913  ORF Transcript_3074/g.6913 Transcript_3074/m.6913 type:complete len:391 (-) Transcript_3074:33-1205(-)